MHTSNLHSYSQRYNAVKRGTTLENDNSSCAALRSLLSLVEKKTRFIYIFIVSYTSGNLITFEWHYARDLRIVFLRSN